MHIRKRRFLAGVLALSLALGMMSPTAAWAAEAPSDSGAVTSGQSVQKSEEPTATPSDASEPEETETPPTEQEPVCICEAPCSEGEMNGDCPVCGAEGATPETCGQYEAQEEEGSTSGQNVQKPEEPVATPSDALEPGETETPPTEQEAGVMTVTAFEPLAAEVARQTVPQLVEDGETVDPVLPDTLSASGYTGIQDSGEAEAITIEGVTWTAQPDYNPATAAEYSFTPALPEGYALAAGLELPVIVVTVLAADNALVPLAEVEEQFENVEPGETYWFDLSGMDILGTPNGGLPDGSRHWVPFTYTGTINAYVLNQNSNGQTGASQSASETTEPSGTYGYTYDHSLFIADYAVTYYVNWDELNSKSMIFGKDYQSGGVDYTLRAPSVGSSYTGDYEHGTPQNNEWDAILDKNNGSIKNWEEKFFWGQDTYTVDESNRVSRVYDSARSFYWDSSGTRYVNLGFRPVLEILNADTLSSDGLSVVAVDLNGGKIGTTGGSVNIVVKSGESFTAPSGEGLTRPAENTDAYFWWLGSDGKPYEPGDDVPSAVTSLTAQWKYPAESTPAITIDYKNETLTGFEDGASYTINGKPVSLNAGGTFALDSSWFGKSLSIVKKGDGSATSDSAPQTLTIPARPAAPAVAINYTAETLSTTSGLEWTSGQSVQRWESCSENMAATAFSWDGSAEVTVHFRTPATESAFASAERELLILARPKAPTGLQGKNETYSGDHDGKITGVSSAMEYQKDGTASWEDCAGEEITGLAPGTYLVRLKATGNAFAGFAASVEIKTGAKRTYTLNVTAPAFEPVSYGYAQPDAAPLTIQSSGNSAATISKVEADSKNFVIGGSGSTVAAGGSINTWTIRPVAGLEADTYKATVTVTYTGGATATAQVSFTVSPAEQAAPSAPALDSRDKHQITLKAVPDNQNGAKAEYSKDGGASWQDSPIFTGLSSGTTYSFIVRYGATADGNYKPSPASPAAEYSTKSSGGSGGGGGGGSSYDYYTISASAGEGGSISPSGSLTIREGRDKTYTITPDKGYLISDVLVDGQSVGAVASYTFENIRSAHTIRALFKLEGAAEETPGETTPPAGGGNHFTDVPPDAWYAGAVEDVSSQGIMNGTGPDTFSPEANTSRAQLAAILWRMAGSPEPGQDAPFTDVSAGAYYEKAVAWCAEQGLVDGYGGGLFGPDDPVTREQIAAILFRYADLMEYDTSARADLSGYTDADKIGAWALEAMQWANAEGIINGTDENALEPQGLASRAQVAAMLSRFQERYGQDVSQPSGEAEKEAAEESAGETAATEPESEAQEASKLAAPVQTSSGGRLWPLAVALPVAAGGLALGARALYHRKKKDGGES